MVRGFRENAWRNAERLVNATSDAERAQVAQSIEGQAAVGAQTIVAQNTVPGYGAIRDAWCREHLKASYRVKVGERRIARILDRGRMRFRVRSDGPTTVRIRGKLLGTSPAAGRRATGPQRTVRITRGRRLQIAAAGKTRGSVRLLPRAERLLAGRRRA